MKVLVTGAAGNAGMAVSKALAESGQSVRMADVTAPPVEYSKYGDFMRCDTRTPQDVRLAVSGMDAVVHLAAWHCAHVPPVSDSTIYAVNVDGTFNVFEACREFGVQSIVYASSMAYGWGSVYGVSKVIGEELCRSYHEMTGAAIAMLRYHDFVPKSYLAYGAKLLRNAVDRRDVASATVAAALAAADGRIGLFRTIVHSNHGMPPEVVANFSELGTAWCESKLTGAAHLIKKYEISLPERVEQHDLSAAQESTGWSPCVGFMEFLADLKQRDARGEAVWSLWTPSDLSVVV